MIPADPRPIGVFDSGIGGLTVLRALLESFPGENFIYLGDTARLPYGSKAPETIRRYSEQILDRLIDEDVKAAVIACNSASTQMPESEWRGRPLYNVIGPGARQAIERSPRRRIGLIGTRATVQSGVYERHLRELAPEAQVFAQACPLLVPLAEEGWDGDPVTNLIVYRYLHQIMAHQVDALILGCTHYPLLEGSIARVTGTSVALIDSGRAVVQDLQEDLEKKRWAPNSGAGSLRLLLTDGSGLFANLARKILGPETPPPEWIDLQAPRT